MRLSPKGRYAVTAMIEVAIHDRMHPVTLGRIAECQGISLSYLEQIFYKLRKSGLVNGVRGPGGGYSLGRRPETINVLDILKTVEETDTDIEEHRHLSNNPEQPHECSLTHRIWGDIEDQLETVLEGVNLRHIMDRSDVRRFSQDRQSRQPPKMPLIFDNKTV